MLLASEKATKLSSAASVDHIFTLHVVRNSYLYCTSLAVEWPRGMLESPLGPGSTAIRCSVL